VDVVWVDGNHGTAQEIKEGEFIVRLDPSAQQEKNIMVLATAVVQRTTLMGIRHSVEDPLQAAIDLNLVRTLLQQVGNKAALDWFLKFDYLPRTTANAATGRRNEQIVALDERGLFTRVLLVELEDFSRRIYGKPPRPYMAGEIEGFVDFLYKVATRQYGHGVPLEYLRAFIRIHVILVAKASKILKGIGPYVKAMQVGLEKQTYSIYVIAFDKDWLGDSDIKAQEQFDAQVEKLDKQLSTSTEAIKDFDVEYSCVDHGGRRRPARCIRYVARQRE
jgi:hypothetical protein